MPRVLGNSINLGLLDGQGLSLEMTPKMRSTHLYICGSTGTGKSKMLEHLIRQDIKKWHKSKCGALILDPHGSLYDSLIHWLAWNKDSLGDVPIVPIDLRERDWTIAYNVMRPRQSDPAVVINNFVQAMAYVWGVDGTAQTPLFSRMAREVLWPIYEKKLTLCEVQYLIDLTNKTLRTQLTQDVSKRSVVQGWAFSNILSPRDLNTQMSSTVNRFYNFMDTDQLRLMFGQNGHSLDLGTAIEEGQIIIVNLSAEGGRVSEEDASLFATLLLSDLWTAAKERGKGTDEKEVKPFYVYVDEFQNFVTPTIAKNLDQARGFGLHLTLANQFPRQILHAGANGAQVYDSVMANALSKIVFATRGEENLRPLALDLFMGVMNPDEIKLKLFSTKVMDYVEETRTIRSHGRASSSATGDFTGYTGTESTSGQMDGTRKDDPNMWNASGADSIGTSHMDVTGESYTETEVPFLKPVMGQELSSVQFRSLEEQLFRAMSTLSDLEHRHGVARLVGTRAPFTIVTPTISKMPGNKERTKSYLEGRYKALPFALRRHEAEKNIKDTEAKFLSGTWQTGQEPELAKRPVKDTEVIEVEAAIKLKADLQPKVVKKKVPKKTSS